MTRRARLLLPLLAVLLVPVASAHAVLQSATPPPDGSAPTGLTAIELVFTENLEREYTGADVFDLNGTSHALGPAVIDADRGNVLHLATKPLPEGIYEVAWRALSVDGHTTRGSYLLATGNATLVPVGAQTEHTHGDQGMVSSEGFTRAVFYAGLLLAVGMPLFDLAFDHERGRYTRRVLQIAGVFAFLGALAGAMGLWYFTGRTSLSLAQALGTETGRAQALRALLLAGAGGSLFAGAAAPERRQFVHATLGLGLALGSLVYTGVASHAAALREGSTLAIAMDLTHLLATATWLGGIAGFLATIPGRTPRELGLVIERFSPVAVTCVAVILGTGVFAATKHMRAFDELWTLPYGRLVLIKSTLILPLVAMGAYNKMVVGPRLKDDRMPTRRFYQVAEAEALVMVGILVVAGALATTPPPSSFVDVPSGAVEPFELEAQTATTHVILLIKPNPVTVGIQQFQVQLHPLSAKQIENTTTVAFKFAAPGEREPPISVEPTKVKPDDWRLEGGYLTKPGTWTVYVFLQRPDEYKKLVFEVPVVAPGTEVNE